MVAKPTTKKTSSYGFSWMMNYLHDHILYLNSSKFFAGVVMIMLNIGSKFISVQFSKSAEEYLKFSITKQLLVFAMAWMGTRDIYTALVLTAVFVILSEYMFNEESHFCVVPHHFRVLTEKKAAEGAAAASEEAIDEKELAEASALLEKSRQQKKREEQKKAMLMFDTSKNS
jgi:hypothetical protein